MEPGFCAHTLLTDRPHARPNLPSVRHDGSTNIWVADYGDSYVWQMNGNGKTLLGQINTQDSFCYDPADVYVDHNRNVWVVCTYNANFSSGSIQEYLPGATTAALTLNYNPPSGGDVYAVPGPVGVDTPRQRLRSKSRVLHLSREQLSEYSDHVLVLGSRQLLAEWSKSPHSHGHGRKRTEPPPGPEP